MQEAQKIEKKLANNLKAKRKNLKTYQQRYYFPLDPINTVAYNATAELRAFKARVVNGEKKLIEEVRKGPS